MTASTPDPELASHREAGSDATVSAVPVKPSGRDSDTWRLIDGLFANSHEAVVLVDEAGALRYATHEVGVVLGYDSRSLIGRNVFEFVHPDDAEGTADLFARRLEFSGTDQGTDLRLLHAAGFYTKTLATVAVLPQIGDLGHSIVAAVTLRTIEDRGDERELALQRRIAVSEYTNELGAELMSLSEADPVLVRISRALGEIGLLTGAENVALVLEHADGNDRELLSEWGQIPGAAQVRVESRSLTRMLDEHLVIDELDPEHPTAAAFEPEVRSLLSSPFSVGGRRGALILTRRRSSPSWWDTDSHLIRRCADLIGRSLRTAWADSLLSLTYRSGPTAFSIHSWGGEMIDCNERYLELFKLTFEGARKFAGIDHVVEPSRARLLEQVRDLRLGHLDRLDAELELQRGDGTTMWARIDGVRLDLPGTSDGVILTSYSDVTSRRAQRKRLAYAAQHDPLTGAANRDKLWHVVGEMHQRYGGYPTMMLIDVDHFKSVNDSFGHQVGDEVLKVIADRLRSEVRDDDLVARIGGDEFAIALSPPVDHEVTAIADRLLKSVQQVIGVDGRRLTQSISIGVAAGGACDTLDELMTHADRALYQAKHLGRNRAEAFDPSADHGTFSDAQLEADLIGALERGEFAVHYQPEIDLASGRVVGAEALIRWHHPSRGTLPAAEFIALAERTGDIDAIGAFAMQTAARDFSRAMSSAQRDDLVLRANLTMREFDSDRVVDVIAGALDDAALAPDRFCVEVTDTSLDAGDGATLERLQQLGVTFAIDNLGAGKSSLANVRDYPIDTLKLDRSFVADIDGSRHSHAIVSSMIELGRSLGLTVVAEGVERSEQLNVLRALGCTRAQGHLFAAPVDIDDFEHILSAGTNIGSWEPNLA